MNEVLELPWTTLYQTVASPSTDTLKEVVQDEEDWIDTLGCRQVQVRVEIAKHDSGAGAGMVALVLEGSNDPDGTWHEYKRYLNGATPPPDAFKDVESLALVPTAHYATDQKLYRYFRWRIDNHYQHEWEICFRLIVTLKR